MSLAQRLSAFAVAVANDIKALFAAKVELQQQVADAAVKEVYAQSADPDVTRPSINFKPDPALGVSFMRVWKP